LKVGSKGDYGLRALIDLAERYESGEVVQTRDIAERKSIPKDYLALIMADLRKGGLVTSVRGATGGYRLAREPQAITMGEALIRLEGPFTLLDCATELGFDQCSLSLRCRMRNVWIEANRAVMEILNSTTIADLIVGECAKPEDSISSDEVMPDGLTFQI